jgi:hypothetical protein
MDASILWRSALLQLIAVAVLSTVLAIALPHDFFVNWGWLAGPAAWMLCAALTARLLDLPLVPALTGAVLSGLPSLVAVILDLHWEGAAVAVVLFALWCGWLAADPGEPAT